MCSLPSCNEQRIHLEKRKASLKESLVALVRDIQENNKWVDIACGTWADYKIRQLEEQMKLGESLPDAHPGLLTVPKQYRDGWENGWKSATAFAIKTLKGEAETAGSRINTPPEKNKSD